MDDPKDPKEREAALCKAICDRIGKRKAHWSKQFSRMRQYQAFVRKGASEDWEGEVVHLAQRLINDWVSALYARNPRTIWKRKPKLDYQFWDGTVEALEKAKMTLAISDPVTAMQAGLPVPAPEQIVEAQQIVEDAVIGMAQQRLFDRIGKTATYLYDHFASQQRLGQRKAMKKLVRRAYVSGVAYVAPDFQRITDLTPTNKRQISDMRTRLDEISRRARKLEEGDLDPDSPEITELQQAIQRIEAEPQVVIREGLTFRYPSPTSIIPDECMTDIETFEGCDEVAEEFIMTREAAEAQWGVKIEKANTYTREGVRNSEEKGDHVVIWQNWNIRTGLVHTVCDGFDQLLTKDTEPPIWAEEFFPWIAFVPLPSDDPDMPFPMSMVEAISASCMEINRSQQLLSDTRYAARPGTVGSSALSTKDGRRITNRMANTHVTLESLDPGRPIAEQIQPFPTPNIDPNVFDISPNIRVLELATGSSEARLEPSSRVSATAVSISEAGHSSNVDSTRDELDDLMSELARRSNQILMREMGEQEVRKIVGVGALWPEADMVAIADEVDLEVEYGSSGYPNQATQVSTLRDMAPLLMQIAGVSPPKLAQKIFEVLDQNIQLEDFYDPMITQSINAMNSAAGATQGGADNAPKPPGPASTEPAIVDGR